MSLRARLTLLYTSLLGGILLLFGVAVYLIISFMLVAQVDLALQKTYSEFESTSNLKSVVNMEVLTLPTLDLTGNVLAQVWDTRSQLRLTNYGVESDLPFDSLGLQSQVPIFRSVYIDDLHLRVLSVPLLLGTRPIATLQLATNLLLVDQTLNLLVTVLLMGSVIAMAIAGVVGWMTSNKKDEENLKNY